MKAKYNFLITGCGGDIGQSICKILAKSKMARGIYGCDIHENHPGKFLCNEVYIIPRCSSENYFDVLKKLIEDKSIDIIIPASEPELRLFLKRGINKTLFKRPLIMANQKSLEIGFDKLKTAHFLKDFGLPYPKTEILSEVGNIDYPAILKSREGAGSKQVLLIQDSFDFDFYKIKYPEFIIQEYLDKENFEYTCGLFRSKKGDCRNIIFKRNLIGGFSGFGIVEQNDEISLLLNQIAKDLELEGAINVQLRLTTRGPIVFEINPRFSSTVLFRDLMGFNDLLWSIEDHLNLNISDYTPVKNGQKFYKGYQEYVE